MTRRESKINFVGLHAHSTAGSTFDAIGYPQEHMEFAYENGMSALALTDHGNMNGLAYQVLHAKKMKADGKQFKPIFGVEAYFIPSLKDWHDLKAAKALEKKKEEQVKEEDELGGTVVEDEESSKKKKNPLNRRAHMVLLAQNQKGLNNIFKLVSESFKPGNFYKMPRIDYEMLEGNSEGIIASSACLGGVYAMNYWENIEKGDDAVLHAMRDTTERMTKIFNGKWFGELQWVAHPGQHQLNQFIIQISKEYDLPLISTADSHYPRPELWKDRELYKRFSPMLSKLYEREGKTLPTSIDQVGYELFPKNGDQMMEAYEKYAGMNKVQYNADIVRKSIENTHHIAFNLIEDFTPDNTVRLPKFVVPEGKTDNEALTEMAYAGLERIKFSSESEREDYKKRLDMELGVIQGRGFSRYFLTMKPISDTANSMQLTGPGRGSGAGALTSYVLGITQVNPITWGLMFERFLRSDAKDYPDIDYDTANNDAVKGAIIDMWGEDNVASISNWNTLQLKSLIKDISKAYKVPYKEVNEVTTVMLIEAVPKIKEELGIKAGVLPAPPTFAQVVKHSESFRKFLEKYPDIKDHITNLFRQVRSCSRHAGGLVVGENLPNFMPLIYSGGVRQTPWSEGQNVRQLEPMGFIKFDILGLSTLRMFENAIRLILKKQGNANPSFDDVKKFYNEKLHPDVINFDDQQVYENVFHKGKWAGIFQFDASKGMQRFTKQAKPCSLIDLSAITSIWRPGPMSADVPKKYVEAKENPASVTYKHPIIQECTGDTYGFLIFQEQIALLAYKLGKDISLDDANLLRKVLTKKGTGKEVEVKNKLHDKFIEGCVEKGLVNEDAEELWQTFIYFSGYGFNKSHAVCYSVISFQCAWLLTYHPAEWLCAYLNEESDKTLPHALGIAKNLGYKIEEVDVNTSGRSWTPSDKHPKTLVQPLTTIKGFGDKAMDQIIENRPFNTIEELLFHPKVKYQKLNKKALDVLIRSGACRKLQDSKFNHFKHFWMSTAFDRPKTQKDLIAKIEKYKLESDFTNEEKISNIADLTGIFPISVLVDDKVMTKLQAKNVLPISEYDEVLKNCWFIIRKCEVKKTKNKKLYWELYVTDGASSKDIKVKCWGVREKDVVHLNRPYVAKLDLDEKYGFSVNMMWQGKNLILVG